MAVDEIVAEMRVELATIEQMIEEMINYASQYTSIANIADSDKDMRFYTTDGKQVSTPQRGINIIRYSDGSSKKVLVK